ncbi:MAG: ATP-binding protein [Oscillospiraceae bacterium]|nr:ATP-binding protein [Oscillospiraceae bacterium]
MKVSEGWKRHGQRDVISKMFFSASIAMMFTVLVGTAAQFLDGVITSRFLGNDAYSAIALFGPLNGLFLMLASFIASGNQIVCAGYIGEGKKDTANSVFTFSVLVGLLISVILILLCVVMPDPLMAYCGVTKVGKPVLYENMLSYLRGYLFGIPALIAVQILGPIVVLDNGKKIFSISAIVLCGTDIVLDLLNALVLHGGTFGMGIATSVSLTVQCGILVVFLLRKDGRSRFTLKAFRRKEAPELSKSGSPTLVQSLAISLRDVSINRLNLFFAVSTAAIVARGIQYDFNMVLFCISDGLASTMVSMSGIYHSVEDKNGLRRVFQYGMNLSLRFAVATFAVVFLCAPLIAGFYTSDPETASLSTFAIRCMALSLLADTPICIYINYLKGIRNRRTVILLNILDRFVFPVVCAAALSFLFGSKGLLASIALGKFLLLGIIVMILWIKNKRFPRKAEQLMLLPENFGGDSSNIYGSVTTMEDVIRESRRIEGFCLIQGTDVKSATRMSLFMEEMGGNIVQYGSPDARKASGAEYRLFVSGNRICLTLRDYNQAFDPIAWHQANSDRGVDEGMGIRMVMALAEDTRYFNAFNSNNLILWLNAGKDIQSQMNG